MKLFPKIFSVAENWKIAAPMLKKADWIFTKGVRSVRRNREGAEIMSNLPGLLVPRSPPLPLPSKKFEFSRGIFDKIPLLNFFCFPQKTFLTIRATYISGWIVYLMGIWYVINRPHYLRLSHHVIVNDVIAIKGFPTTLYLYGLIFFEIVSLMQSKVLNILYLLFSFYYITLLFWAWRPWQAFMRES